MARNTAACQHFVQAMGLKSIFPAFMKSSVICLTRPKEAKLSAKEDDEHVVSIISSLLLRLSGESHARLLAKFVENDFEKVDRLVEMHGKYHKAVQEAGDGDEDEDEDEDEEDDGLAVEERRYIARLEKGLFILQQIAVIISFLLTEEVAGLEDRIRMILRQTGGDLKQVLDTLQVRWFPGSSCDPIPGCHHRLPGRLFLRTPMYSLILHISPQQPSAPPPAAPVQFLVGFSSALPCSPWTLHLCTPVDCLGLISFRSAGV
jgi:hypothetical protein